MTFTRTRVLTTDARVFPIVVETDCWLFVEAFVDGTGVFVGTGLWLYCKELGVVTIGPLLATCALPRNVDIGGNDAALGAELKTDVPCSPFGDIAE